MQDRRTLERLSEFDKIPTLIIKTWHKTGGPDAYMNVDAGQEMEHGKIDWPS